MTLSMHILSNYKAVFIQPKTQQNITLAEYRSQIDKDLPFLYIFSLIVCSANFIVGIIWQNIDISIYKSSNLELPYFGCYIMLASLAIALVFVYNLISLKNDFTNMKYLRRFQLVLSVIVLVATVALTIILSIKANDYRQSQSQLTKLKYGTAILSTVVAIIVTIFALPVYLHLVLISYTTIRLTPDDTEEQEETQSDVQQQNAAENQPASPQNEIGASDEHQQELVPRRKGSFARKSGVISKQSERRPIGQVDQMLDNIQKEMQSDRNIVLSVCIQNIDK